MKRKRDDTNCDAPAKKKRQTSINLHSDKLTLATLWVLQDILGPFCVLIQPKKAIQEADCPHCNHFRDENLPQDVQEFIRDRGYVVHALVRELFHRNLTSDITVSPTGIVFKDIEHVPWFAIQILLFRRTSNIKVHLDLMNGLCIESSDSNNRPVPEEFVKDFMKNIKDMCLKKSLEEFLNKK